MYALNIQEKLYHMKGGILMLFCRVQGGIDAYIQRRPFCSIGKNKKTKRGGMYKQHACSFVLTLRHTQYFNRNHVNSA